MSWKLVLFVGLFLILYIPFVLPFFKFPETEYETLAHAFGRAQIEFLAMITVILAAIAMTRYVDRAPISRIGFSTRGFHKDFAVGSGVGAVLLLVLLGVLTLFGAIHVGTGSGPYDKELVWTTFGLLFNTIHQETLVHGYVQQLVRSKFGSAAGVIASSFVLVIMHWTLFRVDALLLMTNLFAAGVFFGLLFLYSRSLWLPIGAHFGWNYIQGPVLGLPLTSVDLWDSDLVQVEGSSFLTGGDLGLEGGIVASVVLVAASAFMYRKWMTELSRNHELEHTFP